MHRSGDITDEPSRFKQFAWEQWENQPFAVLFRYVEIENEKRSYTNTKSLRNYGSKFFE